MERLQAATPMENHARRERDPAAGQSLVQNANQSMTRPISSVPTRTASPHRKRALLQHAADLHADQRVHFDKVTTMFNEPTTSRPNAFIYSLAALMLAGALVLAGCDSTDANEEPEIEALIIAPSSVNIAVGEQADFSAVALTASGDTIRDLDLRWWSTDSDVFTVENDGLATGQAPGEAYCKVELADDAASTASHLRAGPSKTAKRIFVGRDSAFVSVF